ncbi:unnamed protein product, partial [Laminaria digitata]
VFDTQTTCRWNEDTFGPHFKATPLEGIVAPLTETGIEFVFTPDGVDDDIRREGVLCTIEVCYGMPAGVSRLVISSPKHYQVF